MKLAQAIQVMKEGHRVTHRLFKLGEYLFMKEDKIYFDNGIEVDYPGKDIPTFPNWDDGYDIYDEKAIEDKQIEADYERFMSALSASELPGWLLQEYGITVIHMQYSLN